MRRNRPPIDRDKMASDIAWLDISAVQARSKRAAALIETVRSRLNETVPELHVIAFSTEAFSRVRWIVKRSPDEEAAAWTDERNLEWYERETAPDDVVRALLLWRAEALLESPGAGGAHHEGANR